MMMMIDFDMKAKDTVPYIAITFCFSTTLPPYIKTVYGTLRTNWKD
jgi:hypothetical protein